ncbi:MAG: two-component regulator propeller domain-containing protein [Rhodothermales bacterium]|nr:two-component regulator propeller domain-containing protein [Rhodothermales bacterium]
MSRKAFVIGLLVWVAIAHLRPVQAQDYETRRLSVEDGSLLGNRVTEVVQDHHGFMWICTAEGVVRYDGWESVFYRHDPEDSHSLSDNGCETLLVDRGGTLWVGTYSHGLNRYDASSDSFERFVHEPDDPGSLSHNSVTALYEDRDGTLWVGANAGHINYRRKGIEAFEHFVPDPATNGFLQVQVWEFLEDREGDLWVATGAVGGYKKDGGLIRFSRDRRTFRTYLGHGAKGMDDSRVFALLQDSSAQMWIGTENALYLYESAEDRFSRLGIPGSRNQWVVDLLEGQEGDLLISEYGTGVFHMAIGSPPASRTEFLEAVRPVASEFVNTWRLYRTQDGVVWISSLDAGVLLATPRSSPFVVDEQFHNNWDVFEDAAENLWTAPYPHTLIRRDRTGFETFFPVDPLGHSGPNHNWISDIGQDQNGIIWIATRGGGLNRFDPSTSTFSYFLVEAEGHAIEANNLTSLFVDSVQPWVWVSSGNGIYRFDTDRLVWDQPDALSNFSDGSKTGRARFLRDGSGALWISKPALAQGQVRGLVRIVSDMGNPSLFLTGQDIHDMALGPDGLIWVAASRGLYRLDPSSDEDFSLALASTALKQATILHLRIDGDGDLWLATSLSLWRYRPGYRSLKDYTIADGYLPQFADLDATMRRDGTLVFGGIAGLLFFDPKKDQERTASIDLAITDISALDRSLIPGLVASDRVDAPYEIAFDDNDVSLKYASLYYTHPERNRHQYRLEPYEQDWQNVGEARSARYTNLDPGDYTFSVRAANGGSDWSAPATVHFRILPPWWRTTWAYILYGLILTAMVFGVDRLQRRRIVLQERERTRERELAQAHEIEKAYTQLKTTQQQLIQQEKLASLGALTAGIAHEIKNPLNFITNFAGLNDELAGELREALDTGAPVDELLTDLQRNARIVVEHGQRADRIVQSMMRHASGASGERQRMALNTLVNEYVDLAFHGVRAHRPGFEVAIVREYDPAAGEVDLVPQQIGQVLVNLFNNAFDAVEERRRRDGASYTPAVTVSTRRVAGATVIRVTDNGPGIPDHVRDKIFEPFFTTKPAGSGTGLELSLSYDIVTRGHGGTLAVESVEGAGTTFLVTLPSSK